MYKRHQKKEAGQALIEMAISLPVLILILSGLLDLGRVYYTFIALEEAAAEGARYMAVEPNCDDSSDPDNDLSNGNPCQNPNNAIYRASNAGNTELDFTLFTQIGGNGLPRADWNIPFDANASAAGFVDPFAQCGGFVSVGCIVVVQVRYPYEFLTPGIEAIANAVSNGAGLTLTVQATEIMVYE